MDIPPRKKKKKRKPNDTMPYSLDCHLDKDWEPKLPRTKAQSSAATGQVVITRYNDKTYRVMAWNKLLREPDQKNLIT